MAVLSASVVRRHVCALATATVLVAAFAVLAWRRRWMSDDGFIDLRIVQNLLGGHGPVFNLGERIEAYTNPLWIALVTLVSVPVRCFASEGVALPWVAVVLGLVCTLAGLVVPVVAHIRSQTDRPGRSLPLGMAVVVVLSPCWDFATSGLETGMVFLWLSSVFAVVARTARTRTAGPWWLAMLLGAGPLIRPDLAVFSVCEILVLAVLAAKPARARFRPWVLWALAPVGAYQFFRMGYFAALVPSTAIAKEAAQSRWGQGFDYLVDFARPYHLAIPLVALALWKLWDTRARWQVFTSDDRVDLATSASMAAAALLHGLYIVRVGGDFMHARLLLPTLFALLLPVFVVGGATRPLAVVAGVVGAWAVVGGVGLRVPYRGMGAHGIADERAYYVHEARMAHPVRAEDDRFSVGGLLGRYFKDSVRTNRVLLYYVDDQDHQHRFFRLPLARWVPSPLAGACRETGRCGFLAGPQVHVVDMHGLADAFAARLQLGARGRPGHEKTLPDIWLLARFTDTNVPLPRGGDVVRAALACGDLAVLQQAITAPLTVARFAQNMALASHLTALRIPASPEAAWRTFCGSSPD